MSHHKDRLAVQLYTLRDAIGADLDATLARVASIGYTHVEPYHFVAQAAELKAAFEKHGLAADSAHINLLSHDDQDLVFQTAKDLGITYVIDPFTPPALWSDTAEVEKIAANLNAAAAKGAEYGITVGYHNHAWEISNEIDGVTALEYLASKLDPAVVLEVDTYWAQVGGADPVALVAKLGDRVRFLHIKDGDGSTDTKNQTAVGSGSLPIEAILHAPTPDNIVRFVVELDDSSVDMFDAVADSFAYLTK
ncbi:sugar phosphate isomerase/epimerase [Micrococcales bacterium 31B]|nr:sugar phosphate isomerase/epimerase [Micrococcales bacterium 31B]